MGDRIDARVLAAAQHLRPIGRAGAKHRTAAREDAHGCRVQRAGVAFALRSFLPALIQWTGRQQAQPWRGAAIGRVRMQRGDAACLVEGRQRRAVALVADQRRPGAMADDQQPVRPQAADTTAKEPALKRAGSSFLDFCLLRSAFVKIKPPTP